jgi:hypothetical protein
MNNNVYTHYNLNRYKCNVGGCKGTGAYSTKPMSHDGSPWSGTVHCNKCNTKYEEAPHECKYCGNFAIYGVGRNSHLICISCGQSRRDITVSGRSRW